MFRGRSFADAETKDFELGIKIWKLITSSLQNSSLNVLSDGDKKSRLGSKYEMSLLDKSRLWYINPNDRDEISNIDAQFDHQNFNQAHKKEMLGKYVLFLITTRFERLQKEPSLLSLEHQKLTNEMESLAVNHYGVLMETSHTFGVVRSPVETISNDLTQLKSQIGPLLDNLKSFALSVDSLICKESGLQSLSSKHDKVLDILEIPNLVESLIRNELYDEAFSVVRLADQIRHNVRTVNFDDKSVINIPKDNCSASNFDALFGKQIEIQKSNFESSLLKLFESEIELPQCIHVLGLLRNLRSSKRSYEKKALPNRSDAEEPESHPKLSRDERQLMEDLLNRHDIHIMNSRRAIELEISSSPYSGLLNASDWLRTTVYDSAMLFKALFDRGDDIISKWILKQIQWYRLQLFLVLAPINNTESSFNLTLENKKNNKINHREIAFQRIKSSHLATLYRHTFQTSLNLKRLGASFFNIVSPIFVEYYRSYLMSMLHKALKLFENELSDYSWKPSKVPAIDAFSTSNKSGSLSFKTTAAPLSLLNYRPLALLANEVTKMMNELRQFAVPQLRPIFIQMLEQTLISAGASIRRCGHKIGALDNEGLAMSFTKRFPHLAKQFSFDEIDQSRNVSDATDDQFYLFTENFVTVLIPLMSNYMAITWNHKNGQNSVQDSNLKNNIDGTLIRNELPWWQERISSQEL